MFERSSLAAPALGYVRKEERRERRNIAVQRRGPDRGVPTLSQGKGRRNRARTLSPALYQGRGRTSLGGDGDDPGARERGDLRPVDGQADEPALRALAAEGGDEGFLFLGLDAVCDHDEAEV